MSAVALDRPQTPREGRVARVTTIVLAGLIGMLMMYWTWRGVLVIPFELRVGVHVDDQGSPVRPWAPWWVPVGILAVISMLLWRTLAIRRGRILALRGMLALIATALLVFPVAFLCLELGAVAQYNPLPPIGRILAVLPLMLVGSLAGTAMFLSMNGIVMIGVAAILGLLNAGIGKSMLWIGRKVRRSSA